jgi:ferritin-like metal-binding protein YciE
LVKNGLADFTAENFEIASYKALITAAESLQDQETLRVCQQILADEQDMAQWLDQHLPMAVTEALQQKIAAHT